VRRKIDLNVSDLDKKKAFVQLFERPESHKLFRALRGTLAKKFSVSSGNSLLLASELASYLCVLDRVEEAAEILTFLERNIAFSGDHNIWTPVGNSICLLSRIRKNEGASPESERLLNRIVEHPFTVPEPIVGKFSLVRVSRIRGVLDSAARDSADKLACNKLSNALFNCWYHAEIGNLLGMYVEESRKKHMDELELNIGHGISLLRERLLKAA
jgi:hypothetical protein